MSQTHILNEILGLEKLGYSIEIFGLTASGESLVQEGVAQLEARARYLDRALGAGPRALARDHVYVAARHPLRYLSAALFLMRRPSLTAGYTTTTRGACFLQAVHLSALLLRWRQDPVRRVDHIHSHFAHDPTLVALLVSRLTHIPFSFTAHARDMLQIPRLSLAARIERASAVVSICESNVEYLRRSAPAQAGNGKIRCVHTGIDVDAFRPAVNGHRANPPTIVSIGRLVEKKGYEDLLRALRLVKGRGLAYRCVIYGDGPLRQTLAEQIDAFSLEGEVVLAGPATLGDLRTALQHADIFALTPFVTADGDSEGLPSSLLEAMACGLPVVSTMVAGIPEAVSHGENGLLSLARDVDAIADNIALLLSDERLRRRLGAAARATIVSRWHADTVAKELAAVFAKAASA